MRKNLGNIANFFFWALFVYFCVIFLIPKWEALQLSHRLGTISAGWLFAAGVFTLMHYLSIYVLWLVLLRLLGATPTPLLVLNAFALSLLPKYVPGKLLGHAVRARLSVKAGVPTDAVIASLIWELVLVLGSAAMISCLGFLYQPSAPLQQSMVWLIIAFGAGMGLLAGTTLLGSRWQDWTGLSQLTAQPLFTLSVFVFYTATWLIMGISHWCLANALTSVPITTIPMLIVALALSWGIGILSIIAPAGLGVREGVLYLFVHDWLGESDALLFVTLSRVTTFIVEILLTVMVWLSTTIYRRIASQRLYR